MEKMQLVLCCTLLALANGGFLRGFLAPRTVDTLVGELLKDEFAEKPPPTFRPKDNSSGNIERGHNHDLPLPPKPANSEPPDHHRILSMPSEAEDIFRVADMLLAAAQQAAQGAKSGLHADHYKVSHISNFGLEVTESCIPVEQQDIWRQNFAAAIDLMLQKDLHGMQHGLMQVAHSVVELVDGSSCGLLAHHGLDRLRAQAHRLHVLASAGSLNDMDVAVKYEPLKALTVGGKDVHIELNAMVVAWQLRKDPHEVGKAMAEFLDDFNEELDDVNEVSVPVEIHETRTSAFWADVLRAAVRRLNGSHVAMNEACLSKDAARIYGDGIQDAIDRHILLKTRHGMRAGLQQLATSTLDFVGSLGSSCAASASLQRLQSAAERLRVFASARTLVDPAKNIEYEPFKVLTVGGIDVHKELNRFLVAWLHSKGAQELAEGLMDLFEDFQEHDQANDTASDATATSSSMQGTTAAEEELDMLYFMRDATVAPHLPTECVVPSVADEFMLRVNRALGHILQKRKRSMQQGLKELADIAVHTFGEVFATSSTCALSDQGLQLKVGAMKVKSLTRKTVVDYGTHIKYEALKSLTVGGVDIHLEINHFISAWKLRSPKEAGQPFGQLFRKLSQARGHDEL